MKKLNLKSQLLLGALLLGVGAAGAHHVATLPADDDTLYNWSRVGGDAQPGETNPLNGATEDQAKLNYGCQGGSQTCAIGVNPEDPNDMAEIQFN